MNTRPFKKTFTFKDMAEYGIEKFEVISFQNKQLKCRFSLHDDSILKDSYKFQYKLVAITDNKILDYHRSQHQLCKKSNNITVPFTALLQLIVTFYPVDSFSQEYELEISYDDILKLMKNNHKYEDQYIEIKKINAKLISRDGEIFNNSKKGNLYIDLVLSRKHYKGNHYKIKYNNKEIKKGEILANVDQPYSICCLINDSNLSYNFKITVIIIQKENIGHEKELTKQEYMLKDILISKPDQSASNTGVHSEGENASLESSMPMGPQAPQSSADKRSKVILNPQPQTPNQQTKVIRSRSYKSEQDRIKSLTQQVDQLQTNYKNLQSEFESLKNKFNKLQTDHEKQGEKLNNTDIQQETTKKINETLNTVEEITHKIQKSIYLDTIADSIAGMVQKTLSDYNHNEFITKSIQDEMNQLKENLLMSHKTMIADFIKDIMDDTISKQFQDRSSVAYQKIRTTIKELIDRKFIEQSSMELTQEAKRIPELTDEISLKTDNQYSKESEKQSRKEIENSSHAFNIQYELKKNEIKTKIQAIPFTPPVSLSETIRNDLNALIQIIDDFDTLYPDAISSEEINVSIKQLGFEINKFYLQCIGIQTDRFIEKNFSDISEPEDLDKEFKNAVKQFNKIEKFIATRSFSTEKEVVQKMADFSEHIFRLIKHYRKEIFRWHSDNSNSQYSQKIDQLEQLICSIHKKAGIVEITADVGQVFNKDFHTEYEKAMDLDKPDKSIIAVLRPGYKIKWTNIVLEKAEVAINYIR